MVPFSTGLRKFMKWWNDSAFLHRNCSILSWQPSTEGGNKTRSEGKQWNGVIKDDRTSSDRFSLSTFSSELFSSARAHLVSWIPAPQICQSSFLWALWAGDAASLMELFRCEKNYQLLAWFLLCVDRVIKIWHSTKLKDPAGQLSPLSTETYARLKRTVKVVFPFGISDLICCILSTVVAPAVKLTWWWWYLWWP